jgi:hypothetical protein
MEHTVNEDLSHALHAHGSPLRGIGAHFNLPNRGSAHINLEVPSSFAGRLATSYTHAFTSSVRTCVDLLVNPLFGRLAITTAIEGDRLAVYQLVREGAIEPYRIELLGQVFQEYAFTVFRGNTSEQFTTGGLYRCTQHLKYTVWQQTGDWELLLQIRVPMTITKNRLNGFATRLRNYVRRMDTLPGTFKQYSLADTIVPDQEPIYMEGKVSNGSLTQVEQGLQALLGSVRSAQWG